VRSLHDNVAGANWPEEIREAVAGVVEGKGGQTYANSATGEELGIGVMDFTPAYVWQVVQIVNYPYVFPDSDDPGAHMLFDPELQVVAARELSEVAGLLYETGYLSGKAAWSGGVVAAARFLYYHELGHLVRSTGAWTAEIKFYPEEFPYAEEIYADQFACIMLALELRGEPSDVQVVGTSGIAFAVSLLALSEFASGEAPSGTRSTRVATYRMGRIRHYLGLLSDSEGANSRQSLVVMEEYWKRFTDLLRIVSAVPSPMELLMRETSHQPTEEWGVARDTVLAWCAWGNCDRVRSSFSAIYGKACEEASTAGNSRMLDVMDFVLEQTGEFEPDLGLQTATQGARQ
jgi:hypothetical protein